MQAGAVGARVGTGSSTIADLLPLAASLRGRAGPEARGAS
jgi:hypothetical protein